MPRRQRPPGRWLVLSVTLGPYHKRANRLSTGISSKPRNVLGGQNIANRHIVP